MSENEKSVNEVERVLQAADVSTGIDIPAPVPAPAPAAPVLAEASPAAPPETTPAASKAGFLTEDERVAILEQLSPENLIIAESLLSGFERAQQFAESAEWSEKFERERQHKLAEAAIIAESDSLDEVERVSLYVIGKLALDFGLTRSQVYSDDTSQLYWLFKGIDGAIREALPHIDTDELECIKEAEMEKQKQRTAAAPDADE